MKLFYNEKEVAEATSLSLGFIRADRLGRKLIPFSRVGGRVVYDLDAVKIAVAALQQGGKAMPRQKRGVAK